MDVSLLPSDQVSPFAPSAVEKHVSQLNKSRNLVNGLILCVRQNLWDIVVKHCVRWMDGWIGFFAFLVLANEADHFVTVITNKCRMFHTKQY